MPLSKTAMRTLCCNPILAKSKFDFQKKHIKLKSLFPKYLVFTSTFADSVQVFPFNYISHKPFKISILIYQHGPVWCRFPLRYYQRALTLFEFYFSNTFLYPARWWYRLVNTIWPIVLKRVNAPLDSEHQYFELNILHLLLYLDANLSYVCLPYASSE